MGRGALVGQTRLKTYGKWLGFNTFSMFYDSPWFMDYEK
jgi:hypothetical protein